MIIDENNIILGGNMRYKALKELKRIDIPDSWVKCADELTDEQKRQFIIKDNVGFGEHDWDVLANEWDSELLNEWGLEVWQPGEEVSNNTDYTNNSLDEKLNRFLDAKIKNITIPFENEEFDDVVGRLEKLLTKYNCGDYRAFIYKILENEKV